MNIFVFVVLCGSCLEVVSSEAFLSIKFLNFRNPGGEGSNGHCCDGRFFMCMSPCDHKFTICLDQADSHPRSINYCTYGKSSSGEISNQDYINFRNKIGNLANPIIWRLHFWPGVVRLKINVEDVDDNNNDHVDFLSAPISAIPSSSLTGQRQTIRSRVSLNIEVRLYCGQNYYGYNCSILCEDTDNDSGHYTCNTRTGEKICHTGWEGDNCDKNIDDCVGVTCRNSGVCEDGISAYQCVCQPGYQGRFCEQEINECLIPSNCRHGDCVNNPGSFTCNCHNGYEGPACDVDIDECASSPCHNAALCTDLVGQFKCHCRAGYNGTTCEEDVDECIYAPCTNNGTCVNLIGSFRCDCLLGYRGHDCSLDVDECDRHPCDNSGTCQNFVGGYNCLCAQGFQGTDCERDIDECEDTHGTVCQNGATCHNSPGSFQCACTRGYYGKQCENDVDECVRIQCNNGGTCQNIPGDFYCQCPTGYTGRRCENNINECLSDICKNGGTCTDLDGSFQCACPSYWEGITCEKNVNECFSQPCQNGGTCEDVVEGYVCACPREYLGHHCEKDLNECDFPDTCANNATCLNSFGGFMCDCLSGWQGQTCNEDINECESFSCNNLGSCINTDGSFYCVCPVNWGGPKCEVDVDECVSTPCTNNGTCYNLPGSFFCGCQQGWTGMFCDVDVDECKLEPDLCISAGNFSLSNSSDLGSNTTAAHVMCVNTLPGFLCSCTEGWTGQFCDVDIETVTEPITTSAVPQVSFDVRDDQKTLDKHGTGTEDGLNQTTGSDNATDHHHTGNPNYNTDAQGTQSKHSTAPECLHGGMSYNDTLGSLHCACPRNWSGVRCEVNVSRCEAVHTCGRHGRCASVKGNFQCQCDRGWAGERCERHVRCSDSLCQHGGSCREDPESRSATCLCFHGWKGQFCQECGDDTCHNGGICSMTWEGTRCKCLDGWAGDNCQINNQTKHTDNTPTDSTQTQTNFEQTDCTKTGCSAGSVCTYDEEFMTSYCRCRDDKEGSPCNSQKPQTSTPDTNTYPNFIPSRNCLPNPCHNGGGCTDTGAESFVCLCPEKWTGDVCHIPVFSETCETMICRNGGTCISDSGMSTCVCPDGWTGALCAYDVTGGCETTPCKNEGLCVSRNGTLSCLCQGMWAGPDCSVIVLTIPFYLSCQITPSTQWIVNKGLRRLLEDMRLYEGRKLTVDHKYKIGSSENGDKVTSIHPIITVDDRKLSDPEMEHILNKVSYKFKNYFNCPLFLGAVIGRFSFSAEPLNSATPNWYPGLITACVVFVIVVIALIFIKFRRRLGRDKTYEVRSVNTSVAFRQEIYGDSVFNFRHVDDHARTCELSTDPRDTAMLVKTSGKKKIISIQNPLYATLEDVERTGGGGGGGSFPDTAAQASGGAWPTTSFDDMPDGQPKAVNVSNMAPGKSGESSYSVPTNNSYVTAGEVSAMGMQATSSKRMSTSSSSVSKEDMCAGSSGDNPGGRSYPPYVNVNAGANHQFALENRSDNSLSTFGDKRSRKERQFSERRRKVSQAEYEKYKNLPYIDDPTGGADTSSKGNSRQNAEQRY